MPMAITTSTIDVPAWRRRRTVLVDVILQSIARDESRDLPVSRQSVASPIDVHSYLFQIVAVSSIDGAVGNRDCPIINRGTGHATLNVIGGLEIGQNEAVAANFIPIVE